jgi:hypothetical protein
MNQAYMEAPLLTLVAEFIIAIAQGVELPSFSWELKYSNVTSSYPSVSLTTNGQSTPLLCYNFYKIFYLISLHLFFIITVLFKFTD